MQTKVAVIGINHKKTPVHIREKFSLTETEQNLLLSELKNRPEVIEAFVLSTCNRVEIYTHLLDTQLEPYFLIEMVCRLKKVPFADTFRQYFYCYEFESALRHLLRVSAGLDSLVLGEKQILGQVKDAFALAQAKGLFQHSFNILSNTAIRAGKKAQNETDISAGGSSVGWAAVCLAEKILKDLTDKTILVIGAGKMSQLTLQQIALKSVKKIYLMNRTHEKAATLAQGCGAEIVSFYDLKDILAQVDACITSVSAPHFIIETDLLKNVLPLRNNKELVLIDIAVPRNVDPDVGLLNGVTLQSIDDLQDIMSQNMARRQAAVASVEAIVETKLTEYHEKITKIEHLNSYKG